MPPYRILLNHPGLPTMLCVTALLGRGDVRCSKKREGSWLVLPESGPHMGHVLNKVSLP